MFIEVTTAGGKYIHYFSIDTISVHCNVDDGVCFIENFGTTYELDQTFEEVVRLIDNSLK